MNVKASASKKTSIGSRGLDPFSLLVGRALIDEKFQAKLLDEKTRVAALKDVGIARPTKNQLKALENAIQTLRTMYGTFGEGVGAA